MNSINPDLRFTIHTMDADGSNERTLEIGNYRSWSIDDKIIYSGPNADITKEVLFAINPDGTGKTQTTF